MSEHSNTRLQRHVVPAAVVLTLPSLAMAHVAATAFVLFIRQQTAISDGQFLRSMIPHHSGAILMCDEASLQDYRIRELCKTIVAGQQQEIDQMRAILGRPEPRAVKARRS